MLAGLHELLSQTLLEDRRPAEASTRWQPEVLQKSLSLQEENPCASLRMKGSPARNSAPGRRSLAHPFAEARLGRVSQCRGKSGKHGHRVPSTLHPQGDEERVGLSEDQKWDACDIFPAETASKPGPTAEGSLALAFSQTLSQVQTAALLRPCKGCLPPQTVTWAAKSSSLFWILRKAQTDL